MRDDYLSNLDRDWKNDYLPRLQKLMPMFKIRNARTINFLGIGTGIFLTVSFVAINFWWGAPLSLSLLGFGIFRIRNTKPVPDMKNLMFDLNKTIKNNLDKNSVLKWQSEGLDKMYDLTEEFKSLFKSDNFETVETTNYRNSVITGAKVVACEVSATKLRIRYLTKTKYENGASVEYVESETYEAKVVDGVAVEIKFDTDSNLRAVGHVVGKIKEDFEQMNTRGLEKVDLESIDFENLIDLRANDQRLIRELFNPSLMDELTSWLQEFDQDFYFYVKETSIVFATNRRVAPVATTSINIQNHQEHFNRIYCFSSQLDHLITKLIYHERERLYQYTEV